MASNPYVNKVVFGSVSIIDISDTTAVASDVAQGKYFYAATGEKLEGTATGGGGAAITVTDTTDTHGGIIREITAVNISDTTAVASDVASGKYFYTADGTKTEGTASGGGANIQALSVTQNGIYAASGGVDGYSPVTVNVSGGGGGGGDMSDPIRFFDYDGTLIASYKTVPSALPSVPTHTGLKNGTWNYTLAQVTTQFNAMGTCDVGANYMTESEDTEIDIILREGRLSPYLACAVNGTVEIDWGDNSAKSTVTGTSLSSTINTQHVYSAAGEYTIKIHAASGSYAMYGNSNNSLLNAANITLNRNRVYSNTIQVIRVGANANIGYYGLSNCEALRAVCLPTGVGITTTSTYAFYNCFSLAFIAIPSNVEAIGNYSFQYCYSLKAISLPSGLTNIGTYTFQYCQTLNRITIPTGLTTIGNYVFHTCNTLADFVIPSTVTTLGTYAFYNCFSLGKVTIPSGITSLGGYAFANCYGIAEYHVKPTSPPTISTSTFSNITTDCVIYVPQASLDTYKTASTWLNYASQMVGE